MVRRIPANISRTRRSVDLRYRKPPRLPALHPAPCFTEASRIIYLLPPYYNNLGKRITKAPKLYFLDIGLVCHLVGLRTKEHILHGPMAGALFENFCVQETFKAINQQALRPMLYYLRTQNHLEIDLLIEPQPLTVHPIEVKLSKTPKSAMGSSIERFRKLYAKLSVQEGRIVSLHEEDFPLSQGVVAQGFFSYLEWVKTRVLK